ncbi:MAG: OmpA family protein [Aquabacterium sp.]|nr:OmpA family protein [Aquabacterium sp.]
MLDDNDDGARVGLWVVLGVIALLLFGLIGGLAIRATQTDKAPAAATPAPAAAVGAVDVLIEGPLSGELVGKLFFALGKAELPADATAALAPVLQALAANPAKKLVIAGFHDPSGDAAVNQALARNRAKAVRAAITSQGVDGARVVLRKPEQTAADGPADDARRVEVRLVD